MTIYVLHENLRHNKPQQGTVATVDLCQILKFFATGVVDDVHRLRTQRAEEQRYRKGHGS